jgi:hypothetical protein
MIVRRTIENTSTTAVRECRLHFLRAAAEHPKIKLADSLRRSVFEPSRKRWAELRLPVPNVPSEQWTPTQYDTLHAFQSEESELVEQWAVRHNIGYEWVYEAAYDALKWEEFPKAAFPFIPGYQPPQFIWVPWFFENEEEMTYRRRRVQDFKRALDEYVGEVNQMRKRFLGHRESHDSHYRWAVEHVCLKWGWASIAKADGRVSWQAVRGGVIPILDRIGITTTSSIRKTSLSELSR